MGFRIDSNRVSHERLQDEVIIINVATGSYFSGSGTAADLWTLIVAGASLDEIVSTLASAYGTDAASIRGDLETCIAKLIDSGVIDGADSAPAAAAEKLPDLQRSSWSPPVFDEYTDMWDLLQADPIHDVSETGWPYVHPRPTL
ncbi:MAG: PqqD family protein [Dongiaceae bacterium]